MKFYNDIAVIGIDHGYSNIKTANACFPACVSASDVEPAFTSDLLIYNGLYYTIGSGHREFTPDKVQDDDYYILTLAGIGQELWANNLCSAKVYIAAGLPLTWLEEQRDAFRRYLLRNSHADFVWRGAEYHIDIIGADIYAQGFSAVIAGIRAFTGVNMLCDIGNGTMNIMYINNRKPDRNLCFTENFGTYHCVKLIRRRFSEKYAMNIPDAVIEEVIRTGNADIDRECLETIREGAREYVEDIQRRLREHEYDPRFVRLWISGGGCCLFRNFANYDKDRVTIIDDICANAKGFEFLAEKHLKREGLST